MFKYTLSDKFRQRGVSPDAIYNAMRNRFDALFDEDDVVEPVLNHRIQVRLDERVVRFFYYAGEINNTLLEEKYQRIASISLSDVKETGFDILNFRRQVKNNFEIILSDWDKECFLHKCKTIRNFCKSLFGYEEKDFDENTYIEHCHFKGFPFVKQHCPSSNKKKCDFRDLFVFLMQCCFLYFILDLEDRRSDFAQSPLYEGVRNKLRKSDVYQLLCAKLKYTIRTYEEFLPLNQGDYSFVTRKFADRLMDPDINKVIVPYNYPDKRKRKRECKEEDTDVQLWFYDPETELEDILEKNRRQEHLQQSINKENQDKQDKICLEAGLVVKIRDFLYTKHAVCQAMTRTVGKRFFVCAQILMAVTSAAILASSFIPKQSDCIMHRVFPAAVFVFCLVITAVFWAGDKRTKNKKGHGKKESQWWFGLPLLVLLLSSIGFFCVESPNFYPNGENNGDILLWLQTIFYVVVILSIFVWIICSGYHNNPNKDRHTKK